MAPPPDGRAFADFEHAFNEASSGRAIRRVVDIGGHWVGLTFAGEPLLRAMYPPFAHLETAGVADIEVGCWDSESSGVRLPRSIDPEAINRQSLPAFQRDAGERWAFARPDPGLSAYSTSHSQGLYWWPAASGITYGDLAGGLRAIINWSMAQRGLQFLHSAAVGRGGKAALIVGQSGSGKSSTALTCLLAGMDYLGDDHCLLDLRESPVVHSVYAAAKLHTARLERFPELATHVVNPAREDGEKGVAILNPAFAAQLPRRLPISAVLVPMIGEGAMSRLEPLTRAAALLALAPSTLLQMAAADTTGLGPMGALVRAVPCYRLVLGSNRGSIAEQIASLLSISGVAR